MIRRHVMAGVGLALVYPALARAQASNNAPMAMGDAEMKHMQQTMMVGSLSLATSRIAEKKAVHELVRQFSRFEVAEQETIADILKSMKDPQAVKGTVMAPAEAEVEGSLDAKGKEMVDKLKQEKAGQAFDKEYVKAQITGHRQLLEIQETYLKNGKDPEMVAVAKLARGMIKEHLVLLEEIDKRA